MSKGRKRGYVKKIFLYFSILIFLTACGKKELINDNKMLEANGVLSYTIDGEKTDKKPTKEDGYIVNKIICDNGSDLMWDNDNWEVEFTKIISNDRCMMDFTKDDSVPGYRVTVTSNMANSLDSLSKATTENGTVKIYSKSNIKSVTGCDGVIDGNKVIVKNIRSNQLCNIMGEQTLANAILFAYAPKPARTSFSNIDDGIPGLYTGSDDQGTTYYFSGDGTNMNNWVSFAGKLWRVIRINGNGSIRLLYAGNGMSAVDVGMSIYSLNSNTYNHPAYVGWKYAEGENIEENRESIINSGAYNVVNTWYNELSDDKKNYIDIEAIYCNDRDLADGNSYNVSKTFYYKVYTSLFLHKTPTFKCNNLSDRFTTFGLMTADEVAFAGGVWGIQNMKSYYYLNKMGTGSITGEYDWWTITPYRWNRYSDVGRAAMVIINGSNGMLNASDVAVKSAVIRPVISIKKETLITGGDGSGDNPYTLSL